MLYISHALDEVLRIADRICVLRDGRRVAEFARAKSLAADFVTRGIRCNAICPGTVDTPSLQQRLRDTGDYDKARREFEARQPMKRLAHVDEISGLVAFLASDDAGFITGQAYAVDGGWSI